MVLYSKLMYGSQLSGEKNSLIIRYLVAEILSKHGVLFFLGHPVFFLKIIVPPLEMLYKGPFIYDVSQEGGG